MEMDEQREGGSNVMHAILKEQSLSKRKVVVV